MRSSPSGVSFQVENLADLSSRPQRSEFRLCCGPGKVLPSLALLFCFEPHPLCLFIRQQSDKALLEICERKRVCDRCNLEDNVECVMSPFVLCLVASCCCFALMLLRAGKSRVKEGNTCTKDCWTMLSPVCPSGSRWMTRSWRWMGPALWASPRASPPPSSGTHRASSGNILGYAGLYKNLKKDTILSFHKAVVSQVKWSYSTIGWC